MFVKILFCNCSEHPAASQRFTYFSGDSKRWKSTERYFVVFFFLFLKKKEAKKTFAKNRDAVFRIVQRIDVVILNSYLLSSFTGRIVKLRLGSKETQKDFNRE